MMETLEGRRLLSFDALATVSYGDAEQPPITLTATTDPAAAATTVTSLHIASTDVEEGSPVTLDAVVRAHGSVVPVTGRVAFLAITTPGDAPRYVGFVEVQIGRPASHGPEMAFLLGTAAVGPDGTARLELPSMPLGPHSIVAMFLGNDAPIFETSGDLPRISASSEPQTLVTWTPNGAEEVRSWIVEPGGKAFQIRWGTIMFLDEAPEGAHAIPAAGVHLRQTEGYRYDCSGGASTWCADVVAPAATFAPTAQPLRIIATARGGLSRAAYRYEIVPVGLPETLQDKAEDLASSASQPQLLSVKATTDLRLYLGGETTVTNPPAIMGALRRIAGPLEYLLPAVPDRGSIQSATAGLRVIVPGSGGSSGSGGTTYGAMRVSLGGSSSYSNGTNSISPRQPRIPEMTGTLTFFNGDAVLGSVPLTDRRSALYHAAPGSLALGEHQIRVVYSGDAAHRSQEGSIEVQIRKTPTELKLESSVPSGTVLMPGDTFDLKATVSTLVPDLVKPSGYVRFYASGKKLGKALLGSESRVRFDLPGGTHEITAVYGGSESMEGSVSAVKLTLTVQKVETQLVILSGKPVNPRKKPLYVKSQLNLGGSAPKPQGRVIVRVNGKEVGSGKIGKRIKLKVRGLPVGRHAAFAHYTGDDYTLPNTTPMHEVVVTSKTTAFVMPYTAVRPTLRPPITSVTTPIATLGGHYGSVTGGSYSSVSYSYNGDLSTDARVNADDYFRIDGFMSQAAGDGAAGGELNFDSGIDADDYYLIDQAFLGGE